MDYLRFQYTPAVPQWPGGGYSIIGSLEQAQAEVAAEAKRQRALNGFGELDAPETATGVRLRQAALRAEAVKMNGGAACGPAFSIWNAQGETTSFFLLGKCSLFENELVPSSQKHKVKWAKT